jgi:diguanylate cyclase (GGDEF)-like protein
VGWARRLSAALSRGLYRTLAEDDDRAAYWVRHVRHGVVLSELSALAATAYVLLAPEGAGVHPVLLSLALLVVVAAPLLLRLPLAQMMRDRRGPLFFYGWSIGVTVVVSVAARIDAGHHSPLWTLLFVTLGFMSATYPPYGVAAMGSLMTASYLLVISVPDVDAAALFIAGIMTIYTALCVMVSVNSWAAHDRQVELLRSQRVLAATDELTGGPNRRAFLDRLALAVRGAGQDEPAVVLLVDLDGFKAVNDRDGHAAGDLVLRDVATALSGAVRDTDTVARLGGDEFAVLARTGPELTGEDLAERLRAAVAARGAARGVTASVGLATLELGDDVESVLHRADEGMYRAKTAGGDRVDVRDGGTGVRPLAGPGPLTRPTRDHAGRGGPPVRASAINVRE